MSTTIMKNVVATFVGLAVVFALAFTLTSQARAATLEQSQIDAIVNLLVSFGADQATIDNVRAALTGQPTTGGSTTTTTGGSCSATNFTMNHKMGDKGGEVKAIQKFLNMDSDTQVAATGAGSPGNETDYFGPATKAAVIKFQNKYASEILAPVGLSAGTGYWGASTRAKANAMEAAKCSSTGTSTGTGDNGSTSTGTGVTVSAAAQPANSLAPQGALRVPFTRFSITAGATPVNVTGVKVKLEGLANRSNISTVVLLDENGMQVGRSRVLQSDYTATIGESMTIPANTTKTFTVAANMAAAVQPGEVAAFAVIDVMADQAVNGTLPIVGASHTMNSTLAISSVTLSNGANKPSITTKEIGSTGVVVGSVKITNNSSTEDVVLKSVRFYQAGSASNADLANVKAMVDGVEYPVTVSADGKYYTVSFGNGITIAKGLSKDIDLKADITSGVNRTITFQVYEASDVNVMGALYGYGSNITGTTFPYNVATSTITITGATLNSISRSNAAPVANITVAKPNEVLGAFEVDLRGEGVDTTSVVVNVAMTGTPANETGALTNVSLVDANGKVLAGPVDMVDSNTGTAGAGTLTFSGVTFPAGKTTVFVKGQLSATKFTDGDTVQVSTNAANWTGVRGTVSGNTVTLTGSATANTMTVRTAKATLVTSAAPSTALVAGATNVLLAIGEIDATASGDNVRVSNVTIQAVSGTNGDTDWLNNVKVMADMNGDGTYETQIGTAQSFSAGVNATRTLSFPLTQTVEVAKGTRVKMAVYGDVDSAATSGAGKTITTTFSNASATGATTGVTATVTAAGSGVARSFSTGGALTASAGTNNPVAGVLLDATSSNNASQTIAEVKVTANNVEDIEVRTVTFNNNVTGTNKNRAALTFELYDGGANPIATVTNTGAATLTFDLTANPVVVPAGSYKNFTVKVKTNDVSGTVVNGDPIDISDATTKITVSGVGVLSQGATSASVDIDNADVVYEAYPTISVANAGTSQTIQTSAKMLLAEVTVTNQGDKDITPATLAFDIYSSTAYNATTATADSAWIVEDAATGTKMCGNAANSGLIAGVTNASCTVAASSFVVPAGGSKTFKVYANSTTNTTVGNSMYARFKDADATITYKIGSGTTVYNAVMSKVMTGDVVGPTFVK